MRQTQMEIAEKEIHRINWKRDKNSNMWVIKGRQTDRLLEMDTLEYGLVIKQYVIHITGTSIDKIWLVLKYVTSAYVLEISVPGADKHTPIFICLEAKWP